MSRLKIMLLVVVIATAVIIFGQNRDPIALRLLCPDTQQSCLYQTPALPLALWLGLSTTFGILVNLLVQTLTRQGYGRVSKTTLDQELYSARPANSSSAGRSKYAKSKSDISNSDIRDKSSSNTKSFEVPQKPQNVERSGTNYSYKYREAEEHSVLKQDNGSSASSADQSDSTTNPKKDEEDWI